MKKLMSIANIDKWASEIGKIRGIQEKEAKKMLINRSEIALQREHFASS
jgi:hypothetical protein